MNEMNRLSVKDILLPGTMRTFSWGRAMLVIAVAVVSVCTPLHASAADNIVRLNTDVVVGGGSTVDSAVSVGGSVRVDGTVRKDAVAVGGSVFLGPGSRVMGNVTSLGGTVVRQQGSQVDGDVTIVDSSHLPSFVTPDSGHWWDVRYGFPPVIGVFSFIGFLVLALIVVAVAPGAIGSVSSTIEHGALKSFFLGVLGSASIFPVAFMLVISIIGIVLIPFEMLLVGLGFFVGYIAVAQLIGKKIFIAARYPNRPMVLETVVGTVALWLVNMVPFLGWLVVVCAAVTGFGGVIASLFNRLVWGRSSTTGTEQGTLPPGA